MKKFLAFPFALATFLAVSMPAINFANAQQSETQQEEQQPQSEQQQEGGRD